MTAVSVVIPSFNHARFIAQAIDSVVTQGHRDFELIVVDDGSTDRTRELLTGPYRAVISKLDLGENRGAAAALNRGIEMSDGEWVAILNSDDVYLPHRLERLLAAAAQSGADFLFSDVEIIDDRGALPLTDKTVRSRARASQAARHRDIVSVLSGSQFSVTSSNFFCRKDVVGELGGFRQFRYCHDWDFIIRVMGRFPVHWLDEVLLQYRLHAANTISEPNAWQRHVEYSMVFASALCAPDAQAEVAALDLKSLFAFARVLSAAGALAGDGVQAEGHRAAPGRDGARRTGAPRPMPVRRHGRGLRGAAQPAENTQVRAPRAVPALVPSRLTARADLPAARTINTTLCFNTPAGFC